jgi:hypothetical protein
LIAIFPKTKTNKVSLKIIETKSHMQQKLIICCLMASSHYLSVMQTKDFSDLNFNICFSKCNICLVQIFMLNTRLAAAESMTHDVIRDLLGVKMDMASYAVCLLSYLFSRKYLLFFFPGLFHNLTSLYYIKISQCWITARKYHQKPWILSIVRNRKKR